MPKSIYQFIWRYSRRQQIIITLITVASFPFLYAALELPKIIVNDAIEGRDFPRTVLGITFDQMSYLLTLCAILLALLLINGGFLMWINTFKNTSSERMIRRLRYMLFERILRFPMRHFERVSQGELSAMIAGEVELIREFISDAIALPVFQGGTLLVILYFMFAQDPVLGVAAIALIPVQAYVIPKLQNRINLLGRERVRRARKLSGRVSESVSGIRDIRANTTMLYTLADFARHLEGIFKVRLRIFQLKFFMKFLNTFMLRFTPLLFYSVGGVLILQGRLSLGALVAVLAAYNNLTTPWKELLRYYQRRGDAQIKYTQLVESFDLPRLLPERVLDVRDVPPVRLDGPLEFDDVSVVEEDGTRSLDRVSFQVRPGGRLAVVAAAAGRDRLAHAVTGLIRLKEGEVRIGGKPLAQYGPAVLGARIAYVGVDSYVFDGTVGYNATYGLKRRVPPENAGGEYDLEEARASGNCLYDARQSWTDFALAGVADEAELKAWLARVMRAVEIEDTVFQRALNTVLPLAEGSELRERLVAARRRVMARIAGEAALGELVHPFDFEQYNANLSVAANILFGEPLDERFDVEAFGENKFVRSVLREAGVDEPLQAVGLILARQLVDIFGDPDVDPNLTERFSFVDPARLEALRAIVKKAGPAEAGRDGLQPLGNRERARLVSLACQLVVERHRLAHLDEALQARILEARRLFHQRLPDTLRSAIATFDENAWNDRITLRANLLMGRLALQRANAEARINALIREELDGLGLYHDVLCLAMNIKAGIGGQALPVSARQCLLLARSLVKRPDILVVNDALNALDRETRERIRRHVLELLPDLTLVWIESEVPNISDFDEVLVLRDGRIEKRIAEHREEVVAPMAGAAAEGEGEEVPTEIASEARVLARLPLFRDIGPANLKLLAFGSRRVVFEDGEVMAHQGEAGDRAYVILSGEVDILREAGTAREVHITRSGKDELVGEIALLATVPRTATVRAIGRVEALEIDRDVFLTLVQHDPKVAAAVARTVSERLAMMLEQVQKAA